VWRRARRGFRVGVVVPAMKDMSLGWRAIAEPLAGTRDRTNVYVNAWRRVGESIGEGRFAFILYECL
jgi:hypothetical protein